MQWETKKCVTCSSVIFILLRWSGTKFTILLSYACLGDLFNFFYFIYHKMKRPEILSKFLSVLISLNLTQMSAKWDKEWVEEQSGEPVKIQSWPLPDWRFPHHRKAQVERVRTVMSKWKTKALILDYAGYLPTYKNNLMVLRGNDEKGSSYPWTLLISMYYFNNMVMILFLNIYINCALFYSMMTS